MIRYVVWTGWVAWLAMQVVGCARTLPGTHVELASEGTGQVYVCGAAAPGMNSGLACRDAVSRAVAAIALRFSQEEKRIGEEVAQAEGLSDGASLLERYAAAQALDAVVQETRYNPGEHFCFAMVRWKAPTFVRDGVRNYLQGLKARELSPQVAATPASAPPPPAPAPSRLGPPPPPNSPSSVQAPPPGPLGPPPPPGPAAAAVPVPACTEQKDLYGKGRQSQQKAIDEFQECLRRTKNDENVCYRYKLYVDEAAKGVAAAEVQLVACLLEVIAPGPRHHLQRVAPGHAADVIENRADSTTLFWTYSLADGTGLALELAADGTEVRRTPLAPNQVLWLKQRLGL